MIIDFSKKELEEILDCLKKIQNKYGNQELVSNLINKIEDSLKNDN